MATYPQNVETMPATFPELVPNFVQAPMLSEMIHTVNVEPFPFMMKDVLPTLTTAPLQSEITHPVNVEVFEFGIVVATWEDDLVTQFFIQELPTTRTAIHTVPAGRESYIRYMEFVNLTASPTTINVWLSNVKFIHEYSIAGGGRYSLEGIWDLSEGQQVEAQASMAGLNAFGSGVDALTIT